ncbi:hypothetical protein C356_04612 [Cryptococcus neoformans c45]|nr:hypothetical protein C356_04612 [Cryptococcus neoformans var. grubii c45]
MPLYEPTTPPTPSPAPRRFVSLPHRAVTRGYPFSRRMPSTRPSSASYSQYRDPDTDASLSFDTDVAIETRSCMSEDDLDSRSDIESAVDAGSDDQLADDEDDEVDIDTALQESASLPRTPIVFAGKKRARGWEQTLESDGDDEAEAEVVLGWPVRKGKSKAVDRKPNKFAKRLSTSSNERTAPAQMGRVVSMGGITKGISDLRASSTIISMNVNVAHANPTQGSAHTSEALSRAAGCRITSRRLKNRHNCSNKRHKRKRGTRHFQQLTASDDPFVTLPVLQDWKGLQRFNTEVSEMDVSEAEADGRYDSDATMQSASDIERSTIDATVPRAVVKPDVRVRYEPEQPLSNKQLASLDRELIKSSRGIQRLPSHRNFPVRAAGQQGTSQLRRTSPTSLLPARHVITRRGSLRVPLRNSFRDYLDNIRPGADRRIPGRCEFTPVMSGELFIALLRANAAARKARCDAIKAFNERTKDGAWRAWVGNYALREFIPPVRQWWLEDSVPQDEEAAVENLLPTEEITELSSSSLGDYTYESQPRIRKRTHSETSTSDSMPTEVSAPDRQVRQRVVVEPYNASSVRRQRAFETARRVREAAQQSLLGMLRLEAERIAHEREEEERLREEARSTEFRAAQEEADARIARELELEEAAINSGPEVESEDDELDEPRRAPSPAITEASIRSDPPPYEPSSQPGNEPSAAIGPSTRYIPHRPRPRTPPREPESLPTYTLDRWSARSPPPPPPYNAQTDRQTIIAPRIVSEEEAPREQEVYHFGGIVRSCSSAGRDTSPGPAHRIAGAYPSPAQQVRIIAPVPERPLVDAARAFEVAVDLEEGEDVEQEIWEEEREEGEPQVVGALQRVLRFVWGRRQ